MREARWSGSGLGGAEDSDHAHPSWRANALGTCRVWRDIGYAAGALVAGVLADAINLNATVIAPAAVTAASGLLAALWLTEHLSQLARSEPSLGKAPRA